MSNPETPSLFETIAADEYWQTGPIVIDHKARYDLALPERPLNQGSDGYRSFHRDETFNGQTALYIRSLRGGANVRPLAYGEPIPLSRPGSAEMVKITQDSRTTIAYPALLRPVYRSYAKLAWAMMQYDRLAERHEMPNNKERFNQNAEVLARPDVYHARSLVAAQLSLYGVAYIRRDISYVRTDPTGKNRRLMPADFVDMEGMNDQLVSAPLPPIEVGSVRIANYSLMALAVSKIVAASVVEPSSIAWEPETPKHKKPPKSKKNHQLAWSPKRSFYGV